MGTMAKSEEWEVGNEAGGLWTEHTKVPLSHPFSLNKEAVPALPEEPRLSPEEVTFQEEVRSPCPSHLIVFGHSQSWVPTGLLRCEAKPGWRLVWLCSFYWKRLRCTQGWSLRNCNQGKEEKVTWVQWGARRCCSLLDG
jgi:hypothetical protein